MGTVVESEMVPPTLTDEDIFPRSGGAEVCPERIDSAKRSQNSLEMTKHLALMVSK